MKQVDQWEEAQGDSSQAQSLRYGRQNVCATGCVRYGGALAWVAVGTILWSLLIYQLQIQWTLYEQYRFGWSVPVLCGWLLWRRWSAVSSLVRTSEAGRGVSPMDLVPGARGIGERPVLCLLVAAGLLYAPTRWLHEANPVWRLTSLLWTVEAILITLGVVRWLGGSEALRRSWLPIAFFLFAVPWPSALEHGLVTRLTQFNAAAAVEALRWLGVPALQHGNIIETDAGSLGIDEACSGLRSIQATLMLSVFLGEFYRLNRRNRCGCILAGCLLGLLCNLARTVFLAAITVGRGLSALSEWHDPAGVSVVLTVFLALWGIARALASEEAASRPAVSTADPSLSQFPAVRMGQPLACRSGLGAGKTLAAGGLILWLGLVELGTELWYRAHEKADPKDPQWTLRSEPALDGFEPVQTRPEILAEFGADETLQGRWRDSAATAGQVYYFRWRPARSLRKRAQVQLAKAHGPTICLPAIGLDLAAELETCQVSVGGAKVSLRQYAFRNGPTSVHVFYGLYEWAGAAESAGLARTNTRDRVAAALAGSRNSQQVILEIALFGILDPDGARARMKEILPVLLEVPSVGSPGSRS
jgi:exosortase